MFVWIKPLGLTQKHHSLWNFYHNKDSKIASHLQLQKVKVLNTIPIYDDQRDRKWQTLCYITGKRFKKEKKICDKWWSSSKCFVKRRAVSIKHFNSLLKITICNPIWKLAQIVTLCSSFQIRLDHPNLCIPGKMAQLGGEKKKAT